MEQQLEYSLVTDSDCQIVLTPDYYVFFLLAVAVVVVPTVVDSNYQHAYANKCQEIKGRTFKAIKSTQKSSVLKTKGGFIWYVKIYMKRTINAHCKAARLTFLKY